MKPRGSETLFAMRMNGHKPGCVIVEYGAGKPVDWVELGVCPSLRILPEDPVSRLDLRCVLGLGVVYLPEQWTDAAASLYERLTEYAESIHVVSMCFDPDMGWAWHHHYGRRELGDLAYIDRLRKVQDERSHWAQKRNDAKYQDAVIREQKIITEAPWLIS